MSERKKRTWEQAYMDYYGTPVRAENRSKKVNAWAEKKKIDKKLKKRTMENNNGNSGGHGF